MKHVSIPLPQWHWCYEPTPNEMTEDAETRIIMAVCAMYDMPRVLEIGTHKGGTTANIAKTVWARKGMVITVDVNAVPESMPEDQRGECLPASEIGSLVQEKHKSVVHQLLVDPSTDEYFAEIEKYAPFDVIFYDGDHSYEGISRDIRLTSHMLADGGVRLLHDVWWDETPPPVDGPLRYMTETRQGWVINFSHVGVLSETELNIIRRYYASV